MEIWTIRKRFEAFELKFEQFEKDSKHSNPNLNQEIEWKFEPFKNDSKHLNRNSNNSKGIRTIQIHIQTIRKGFEAFENKIEPLERDSKHSNPN